MQNDTDSDRAAGVVYEDAGGVIISPGTRGWSVVGVDDGDEGVEIRATLHDPSDSFRVARRVVRIPLSLDADGELVVGDPIVLRGGGDEVV